MKESAERQIVNFEEGVSRFAGHKELYEKYLRKFFGGNDFESLCGAMEKEDYSEAFRQAHTLKGAVGNLSFDRLYDRLCTLTEMLRGGKDIPAAISCMPELQKEYEVLMLELGKLV